MRTGGFRPYDLIYTCSIRPLRIACDRLTRLASAVFGVPMAASQPSSTATANGSSRAMACRRPRHIATYHSARTPWQTGQVLVVRRYSALTISFAEKSARDRRAHIRFYVAGYPACTWRKVFASGRFACSTRDHGSWQRANISCSA